MSLIHLCTTAPLSDPVQPYAQSNYRRLLASAAADRFRAHALTEDPAEAEAILFVGSGRKYHADIKTTQVVRRFPDRCFVWDEQDNAIRSLPGIYTGLSPTAALTPWFRTGFYLRVMDNDRIHYCPPDETAKFLFSFRGKVANAPVRSLLMALRHPQAYLCDSDSGQSDHDDEYVRILRSSKFVLCPRGLGPSTWRLYETMRAGRVPVILSDDWVPPRGPAWHRFSLRVAERDFASVPLLCERWESEAPAMGALAREAWESWFSRESAFHRIVEWCLSIRYETMGMAYRMPGRFMPIRTLNRMHFVPFWKEFVRDRLVSAGLWSSHPKPDG